MSPNFFSRRPPKGRARPLRIETLESRQMLDVALADDLFQSKQNGQQEPLDVLANDTFAATYSGAGEITSVSYGSQGGRVEIAPDQKLILYTPPADYFGAETFTYAVDGQFTARATIEIAAPLEFDAYEIPPDGQVRSLDVMANDPFWTDYAGARQITSVSVGSAGGLVEIGDDGQSIRYRPPTESFGSETFVYVVDDLYPARVTVNMPTAVEGDQYEFVQHAPPATLRVLANDPFWPGYGGELRITHVTESSLGATVEISGDGTSLRYTQPETFDRSSYDSFRYVVDGTYEASVSVVLHRPVQDDYFEVDRDSNDYFYSVLANDWYYDLSRSRRDVIDQVTAVGQSDQGGVVAIAASGQGILYTPPEGFSGSDQFTYTADGVHQATVRVSVTRPVRDDYQYSGIYQDTPDNVVSVLDNDFIGNGYAGPGLITDVTTPEEGGTVAIGARGRTLLYTPPAGYVGQDRFVYTVDDDLTATAVVQVAPLAQHDSHSFCADPAAGSYLLHLLSNDHFDQGYLGPGELTSVEVVDGGGQVALAGAGAVRFTPASAGSHRIEYTVDGVYQATASISISGHLRSDQFVVDQNSAPTSFDVLTNDFPDSHYYQSCPSHLYPGARALTGVTESEAGGEVSIDPHNGEVRYRPPEDFLGTDRFTYTVDDFMTTTVAVEVIRRVRDDRFRVDGVDGPQTLPVLANDLFGADYAGPGIITDVTTAAGGAISIVEDGQALRYAPDAGFVGTEVVTYTVDGALKADVEIVVDTASEAALPTFDSTDDFHAFLVEDALQRYQYLFGSPVWYYDGTVFFDGAGAPTRGAGERNHSETNVQVAGVDEGDIVEFDSDYVYVLTDDGAVILDAWPAEEIDVASRVEIEGRPVVEYLKGDRLTVISETGGYDWPVWYEADAFGDDVATRGMVDGRFGPIGEFEPWTTYVTVLDVSDRTAPAVVQTTSMEGRYIDSRGVEDYVYLLLSNDGGAPPPEVIDDDDDPSTLGRYETQEEYLARVTATPGQYVEDALPNYTSYGPDDELVRTGLLNLPEDIYEPVVADAWNLVSVVSLSVVSDEPGLADSAAVYSTGASTIYASLDNFYVFDGDYVAEDGQSTRIMKFDWDPATGGVEFAAQTVVPGYILNQFSADERDGVLRIATTVRNHYSGNWSGRSENTLFVLAEDNGVMEMIGSLQNLALDETMQSVRFLGDRAFVTTYRNVDPLFALDLSDPANPRSVGHITLPGFTTYMHLVDENFLLTVGRNTPAGLAGPTQTSLFDISDLTQPRRIAEYTFPRFSTSEAEIDHHAFGYFSEHGLLGMPVATQYIERVDEDDDGYRETARWRREDRLAVFSVDAASDDPAQRLILVSEIEHPAAVRRSGYIGDKLYSISSEAVRVVDVSAPTIVIGEANIAPATEDVEIGSGETGGTTAPPRRYPAVPEDPALALVATHARADLARQLGTASEAPMLVSIETAPASEGEGEKAVFEVAGELYVYRSNVAGLAQLAASQFEFTPGADAWNSLASVVVAPPLSLPGDIDQDGRVRGSDFLSWQRSVEPDADPVAEAANLQAWQANLGETATPQWTAPGDYAADGQVTGADFLSWQRGFSNSNAAAADGNRDGRVDAADLAIWAANYAQREADATVQQTAIDRAIEEVRFDYRPLRRDASLADSSGSAAATTTAARAARPGARGDWTVASLSDDLNDLLG